MALDIKGGKGNIRGPFFVCHSLLHMGSDAWWALGISSLPAFFSLTRFPACYQRGQQHMCHPTHPIIHSMRPYTVGTSHLSWVHPLAGSLAFQHSVLSNSTHSMYFSGHPHPIKQQAEMRFHRHQAWKRKDSTVLAIFSTHSSCPFTELRLAGRRISRPKLLCSWTLLSGTGLYSSPQSITLFSQSSDWTELIVFLWNSDQCYIYCIWAKSHE